MEYPFDSYTGTRQDFADYLSTDALEHLAEYFNLNPDWGMAAKIIR